MLAVGRWTTVDVWRNFGLRESSVDVRVNWSCGVLGGLGIILVGVGSSYGPGEYSLELSQNFDYFVGLGDCMLYAEFQTS